MNTASKNQANGVPTALGTMLQASTYGMAIPVIYGMTQSNLLAIWAGNVFNGPAGHKKFKSVHSTKGAKKGAPDYYEQIDFLIGHNPILGVNQLWINGGPIPLAIASKTFTLPNTPFDSAQVAYVVGDPNFYSVIGCTMSQPYSVAFNDYGGTGASTQTGTTQTPLWNACFAGPDPSRPRAYAVYPFSYRWQPEYGNTVYIDALADEWLLGSFPGGIGTSQQGPATLTVWYYQLTSAQSYQPPLTHNYLFFENELGNGDQYVDLPAQQIVYPQFAGIGSAQLELGSSGSMPSIQAEVLGKFGRYPTGDADFADIIEDVFKSGYAQAAIGASATGTVFTQMEHGLSSYRFPGAVQIRQRTGFELSGPYTLAFDLPNTAGNILLAFCDVDSAITGSITDSLGNQWIQGAAGTRFQVRNFTYSLWYCIGCKAGQNAVTFSNNGYYALDFFIMEIAGVDTFDGVALHSPPGAGVRFSTVQTPALPTTPPLAFPRVPWAGEAAVWSTPGSPGFTTSYPAANNFQGGQNGLTMIRSAVIEGPEAPPNQGLINAHYGALVWSNFPVPSLPSDAVITGIYPVMMASGVGTNAYTYGVAGKNLTLPFGGPDSGVSAVLPGVSTFAEAEYTSGNYGTDLSILSNGFMMGAQIGLSTNDNNVGQSVDVVAVGVAIYYTSASTVPAAPDLSAPAAVTTSNQGGVPACIFGISLQSNVANQQASPGQLNLWDVVLNPVTGGDHYGTLFVQQRNVNNPGTYSLEWGTPRGGNVPSAESYLVLIAFKASQPVNRPKPFTDFIDNGSLDQVRLQCRANSLYGSLTMNSQQAASDWLKQLYAAADAAPVFMGFKLYSMPYSEVSAIGNGAVYNAPSASGPVADLSVANGDILDKITVKTKARINLPNVLQLQCISRSSNYQQVVVAQPEAASIALYGVRKADPVVNNAVQDATIARQLLGIASRKNLMGGDTYSFTLNSKWDLLVPLDLVTVSDAQAGINKLPVRLTKLAEQSDGTWSCEAEPFVYGMYSPVPLAVTNPSPTPQSKQQDPGPPNAPVIFEPTQRLAPNAAEIWLAASGANVNYGGCQVFVSTDGGVSYQSVGSITGSAITGVTVGDWPAAADPDAVNNLALDLTESGGSLSSYAAADRDNFKYLGYVAGGAAIPYELMAYNSATLTGTDKYTLNAAGTGNDLRRAVFGCPQIGQGVDHPAGSRFLFIDPMQSGILKIALPRQWTGVELYFKLCAFNTFGAAVQSLASATAYTYTPSGLWGGGSSLQYTQTPAIALSQPTSTSIAMAAVSVAFAANSVKYNARTFTIPAPATATWYYVTIADSGYVGDTGTQTNLAATCQTSNALVGVPGNTFVGAILALPAGGATTIEPGGWPQQPLYLVNGN